MKNRIVIVMMAAVCSFACCGLCEASPSGKTSTEASLDIARLKPNCPSGAQNAGWDDKYPDIEKLDAGRASTIAMIEGPAVITHIHITRHFIQDYALSISRRKALTARGIIFEAYYDGSSTPSIRVPLGDFFVDGCGGQGTDFSTRFVEIAPDSYNCFIPMPFKKSAKLVLRNETTYNMASYSCVQFEQLEKWEDDIGYLHATWDRFALQLKEKTNHKFFHLEGQGHLLGQSWSICSDESYFKMADCGFIYLIEGNNEIYIDGEKLPRIEYLGTECAFGFCWGFLREFKGLYSGINYVSNETPSMVSLYRFRDKDVIRFNKSLDWYVNWTYDRWGDIVKINEKGRGWLDYAATTYWYQKTIGHNHNKLMPLEDRIKPILHPNPVK